MDVYVGKTSGFCFGVKNAVDGAEKILEEYDENIYCLGEIIHNEEVIKSLKEKGLIFIDNINESHGKTIIRAHGVPKEIYQIAINNNIKLFDYTCPFVLKIHDQVSKYSEDKYFIFLLGIKKHPETVGTISFCGDNSYIIENLDDIDTAVDKFNSSNLNKILIISQTTFSVSLFNDIVNTVKEKIPSSVNLEVLNTICNTTSIRQKETEELAKKVDFMIIIGGKNSSNTKKLYEIAVRNCSRCLLIQTSKDLESTDFSDVYKIGVMAGASTPQNIIDDVVNFCKN